MYIHNLPTLAQTRIKMENGEVSKHISGGLFRPPISGGVGVKLHHLSKIFCKSNHLGQ